MSLPGKRCCLRLGHFSYSRRGSTEPLGYFWGSHIEEPAISSGNGTVYSQNLSSIYQQYFAKGPAEHQHDVFELCGGDARTTRILIRRRSISASVNFDLVVGINLLDQAEVQLLYEYIDNHRPICGILSPPCTGLSGSSDLNRIRNPVGWWKNASISLVLGNLAGWIAVKQLREGRHFICENLAGSALFSWQRQ